MYKQLRKKFTKKLILRDVYCEVCGELIEQNLPSEELKTMRCEPCQTKTIEIDSAKLITQSQMLYREFKKVFSGWPIYDTIFAGAANLYFMINQNQIRRNNKKKSLMGICLYCTCATTAKFFLSKKKISQCLKISGLSKGETLMKNAVRLGYVPPQLVEFDFILCVMNSIINNLMSKFGPTSYSEVFKKRVYKIIDTVIQNKILLQLKPETKIITITAYIWGLTFSNYTLLNIKMVKFVRDELDMYSRYLI